MEQANHGWRMPKGRKDKRDKKNKNKEFWNKTSMWLHVVYIIRVAQPVHLYN